MEIGFCSFLKGMDMAKKGEEEENYTTTLHQFSHLTPSCLFDPPEVLFSF
jgi:hypothetical protein